MRHSSPGRLLRPHSLLAAACMVGAIVEACVLLAAARHGFDFTDEGYYLNAIANDAQGAMLTSEFGWIYRVLAFPFSSNVLVLRSLNIVTVLLAGSLLGAAMATRCRGEGRPDRPTAWATTAGLGAASLGFFGTGLLTPSYNSLAATGVLMVASGLVLTPEAGILRGRLRTAVGLVAIGGLLAFLGKPSSGVATGLVAGAALVATGPAGRRVAAGAAGVAATALLAVSLLRTGTPLGVLQDMLQGVREARTLQAGHDLSSALTAFGMPQTSSHALLLSLVLAAMSFAWARSGIANTHRIGWFLLTVVVTGAAVVMLVSQRGAVSFFVPTRAVVILGAPIGLLLAALTTGRRPDRGSTILAVALFLLPHAWVFGSNNDYWHGASLLCALWFASAFTLLPGPVGSRPRTLTPYAAVPTLVLSGAVVAAVLSSPYRQVVPVLAQQTPAQIGPSATLKIAPDFARAIAGFRDAARAHGFTAGTPVLDLTGQMPGLIFALNGRAVGAPWIIGGYPGSDAVARRTLSRTPCASLAHSWLLLEPGGSRQIDSAVLETFGAQVDEWTPVAQEDISTVPSQDRRILLLRPNVPPQRLEAACEVTR